MRKGKFVNKEYKGEMTMPEQKFFKSYRTVKAIQLFILGAIELVFLIILFSNKNLSDQIYNSKPLFCLCAVTWILMLFSLFGLLYDFYRLRSLTAKNHLFNQFAYLDRLTGIPNRYSLDIIFQAYTTPESLAGTACALFSIDNLKTINNTLGHEAGDKLIKDFCTIFEEVGDCFGFIGRNGGNEFVAVIENSSHDSMKQFMTRLENSIRIYNMEHTETPITLRSAYTLYDETEVQVFAQLLAATYNKLYPSK